MKKSSYFIAIICILYGMQACNQQKPNDTVRLAQEANNGHSVSSAVPDIGVPTPETFTNANFAVYVADDDLTEIGLGEIAIVNTLNPKIKEFSQAAINDHQKINKELSNLASKKGISLPPSPGMRNMKEIKRLSQKMGSNFDRHFINMMIELHEKDIRLFEMALENSTDSDIKAFANNNLPLIRNHLETAKSLKQARESKK